MEPFVSEVVVGVVDRSWDGDEEDAAAAATGVGDWIDPAVADAALDPPPLLIDRDLFPGTDWRPGLRASRARPASGWRLD